MRRSHITPRIGLVILMLTSLVALISMTGSASAATSCSEVPTVYGIPPWGFHTGSYTGERSFAKGHGNIDLEASTVSGIICQQDRAGTIIMSVQHHLSYHSHYAVMWGYPGNIMKIKVRVTRQQRSEMQGRNRRTRDPVCQLQRRAQRQRPVLFPRQPARITTTFTTGVRSTTRSRRCSPAFPRALVRWPSLGFGSYVEGVGGGPWRTIPSSFSTASIRSAETRGPSGGGCSQGHAAGSASART